MTKLAEVEQSLALLQAAEAALSQAEDILYRMRALAERAARELDDKERAALNAGFRQLKAELEALCALTPDLSGFERALGDEAGPAALLKQGPLH